MDCQFVWCRLQESAHVVCLITDELLEFTYIMHVRYILHLHLRWNRRNKNNVLPRRKTYNHVVIRYRFSYVPKNTEPFVVFTEFFQKVVIFFKVAKFQRAYYFLKSTHYIIFSERNYWIPLLLNWVKNWYNECIISTIELAYIFLAVL